MKKGGSRKLKKKKKKKVLATYWRKYPSWRHGVKNEKLIIYLPKEKSTDIYFYS